MYYVSIYCIYSYIPNLSPVDSVGELPPRSMRYIANERPRLGLLLRRRRPRAQRPRGAGRWHTRRRRPAGGTSVQEMGNGVVTWMPVLERPGKPYGADAHAPGASRCPPMPWARGLRRRLHGQLASPPPPQFPSRLFPGGVSCLIPVISRREGKKNHSRFLLS